MPIPEHESDRTSWASELAKLSIRISTALVLFFTILAASSAIDLLGGLISEYNEDILFSGFATRILSYSIEIVNYILIFVFILRQLFSTFGNIINNYKNNDHGK